MVVRARRFTRLTRLAAVAASVCLVCIGSRAFVGSCPWSRGVSSVTRLSAHRRPYDAQSDEHLAPNLELIRGAAATGLAILLGLFAVLSPASAESKRVVGEIPASGFIFKDTINVEAFEDPKVSGVSLYISDFSRSMADRVSKGDFFSDPGAAGLTCARNGPVMISPDLKPSKEGEDVFTESRAILFKTLKVKRIYDADAKNILYVAFTERMDNNNDSNKSRFKSQVVAVHIDGVRDKP
ncbi:creA [Symbiodinium necroappetens]|uniref:CreA protein n=1 Tax=Symbiodinium necroappetens TaxID=1628268 RepID=A0A812JUT4_9DINO|nr:creA [Symbiodinium necroappetens]